MTTALSGVDGDDPAFRHIREVWDRTHDPATDFATTLEEVFEFETDCLGLPYGFLTRIDLDAGVQTFEVTHGDHESLDPGRSCPLAESYCRRTVRQPDGVFVLDDAAEAAWTDDPAYERFGFDTYVGATVNVDGTLYGTFCFASSEPRQEPLGPVERELVEMLAGWAAHELDARATRAELERRTEQVEELASVVSHDLRNPLNVAQGQVELLGENLRSAIDSIDRAHDRINDIIETMLTLARADEPVENPEALLLERCVADAWAMVATREATLSAENCDVRVVADRTRLQQLFENLFRNAVEHAGDAVTVTVGPTEGGFFVADDGPGIPASERAKVFDPGYTSVAGGTGFGLSIVRRIADAHGWKVSLTESADGGARIEFSGIEFDSPGE